MLLDISQSLSPTAFLFISVCNDSLFSACMSLFAVVKRMRITAGERASERCVYCKILELQLAFPFFHSTPVNFNALLSFFFLRKCNNERMHVYYITYSTKLDSLFRVDPLFQLLPSTFERVTTLFCVADVTSRENCSSVSRARFFITVQGGLRLHCSRLAAHSECAGRPHVCTSAPIRVACPRNY